MSGSGVCLWGILGQPPPQFFTSNVLDSFCGFLSRKWRAPNDGGRVG
eukprot:CAMPEP_0184685702 /NCGR_PEP_ID=MMETSP0312-20130426/19858_1 /TAXON_ID=31354 /ORGANISM="Compsopogon coeruleus, Strain SAG 36.94" /LENGTH=46 /DNA_ID= /DNA_START= /DNA_END= /DNA_ORIENTATION=